MKITKEIRRINKIFRLVRSRKKLGPIEFILFNLHNGFKTFRRAEQVTRVAFIISFIWIFILFLIALFVCKPIWDLSLNELGDFLAGSLAPLAVLWFIIGYFQQGKELQLQRQELKLTTQELGNQTKQLAEQSKLTQEDLKLRLAEGKPRLKFHQINWSR